MAETAAPKKTPTRIYMVIDTSDNETVCLVQAASNAQALRHVASSTFRVSVPTQAELVKAVREGAEVEIAGDEPAPTE